MSELRRPDMPNLEPRQLWLIEQPPEAGLAAVDRAALAGANVVIYDRPLASMVAEVLPLGTYAEPVAAGRGVSAPALSPRALQLLADGWSVVQFVEPDMARRERLRQLAGELNRENGSRDVPIRLVVKTDSGAHRQVETCLYSLPDLIDGCGADERLTVILGPLAAGGAAMAAPCFTANGLAG